MPQKQPRADTLPAAQTGANTFGCRVIGRSGGLSDGHTDQDAWLIGELPQSL